jgi:uncharacterized protein YaiI (UPF0178 family)
VQIWIDADNCPVPARDIVLRASKREGVKVVFVANRALEIPTSPLVKTIQVDDAPQASDDYINMGAKRGDLVITADIPLAARLVAREIAVINPREGLYTRENIRERLSLRNSMNELRSLGVDTHGSPRKGPKALKRFAEVFDRMLTKLSGEEKDASGGLPGKNELSG